MAEPNDNKKFKFSREFSVDVPPTGRAYFIPVPEWERLKRSISKIAPTKNWFQAGGWLFLGIAITSFLGMLVTGDLSFRANTVSWAVVICFGVLAAALFYLDTQQRQDITQSVKSVTDEMLELEKSYAAQAETDSAAPQ